MDNRMEWLDSADWRRVIAFSMNQRLEVWALCFQSHAVEELLEISR